MFVNPTYGKVDFNQMIKIMREFYNKNKDYSDSFNIVIGTDSQNFSDTKMVSAIVMQCEGRGGIYFYKVEHIERISDVRVKLSYETQQSLHYADELLQTIMELDEELFNATSFAIHVDAGYSKNGKTRDLIPGLIGWVHASGLNCVTKPNSYAASTVANRISK